MTSVRNFFPLLYEPLNGNAEGKENKPRTMAKMIEHKQNNSYYHICVLYQTCKPFAPHQCKQLHMSCPKKIQNIQLFMNLHNRCNFLHWHMYTNVVTWIILHNSPIIWIILSQFSKNTIIFKWNKPMTLLVPCWTKIVGKILKG